MIWTDTFANNRQSDIFSTTLGENNARLAELNRQDIRVIVGNPPYSVGQDNANDDNQNEHYEELDGRIAATYAARTEATLKNSLYDSYIRAYRWASDRIGEKGIISFVTNAGWIDSNSADGMRKCLAEEFSAIYIYHLKGNQRTSGERSRQEGGKVFGEGSRAPVAIVFLVKNPETTEHGKIYFHAVGDYLTRDEKLAELKRNVSIAHTQVNEIVPDAHGDWLNQRDDSYARFMRVDGKKASENSIFKNYSRGVATSRDAWVYGSNKRKVLEHVANSITFYNSQVKALAANPNYEIDLDPKKMKWDRLQKNTILRGKIVEDVSVSKLYLSYYRPFFTQYLYLDRFWNNCVYQMPAIFPTCESKNLLICSSGVGSRKTLEVDDQKPLANLFMIDIFYHIFDIYEISALSFDLLRASLNILERVHQALFIGIDDVWIVSSTHLFARALSQKILNASNVCTRRVRQTYKNPLDLIGKAREKRMLKRLVSPGICSRRLGTTKPATREGEGLNGFLTPFFAKALRLRRRTSRVRVNTST